MEMASSLESIDGEESRDFFLKSSSKSCLTTASLSCRVRIWSCCSRYSLQSSKYDIRVSTEMDATPRFEWYDSSTSMKPVMEWWFDCGSLIKADSDRFAVCRNDSNLSPEYTK